MMTAELFNPLHIIFYIFAFFAIVSALAVITVKNPVRSVLALVMTFFSMAGIWLVLRAEFLSIILVLVYVGAVMTLFLFVLMMLNIRKEGNESGFVRYFPFGILMVLMILGLILIAIGPSTLATIKLPAIEPANYSNTAHLGEILFNSYVYPFEIAGVLLLTAIIAAITLAHRKPRRKVQFAENQIEVKPSDRLRIIKMQPSKQENMK